MRQPRKPRFDLALAILMGSLWVLVGVLQIHAFAERSLIFRLTIGLLTLPLLWVSARHFARYLSAPGRR